MTNPTIRSDLKGTMSKRPKSLRTSPLSGGQNIFRGSSFAGIFRYDWLPLCFAKKKSTHRSFSKVWAVPVVDERFNKLRSKILMGGHVCQLCLMFVVLIVYNPAFICCGLYLFCVSCRRKINMQAFFLIYMAFLFLPRKHCD